MSFEDISLEEIKMHCDWCGAWVWWIKEGESNEQVDGWTYLDTHVVIGGELDQPYPLEHMCPACYDKKLSRKMGGGK